MLDAAQVGKGTRLLDAGCGGGSASVLAAGRGAQVSGLDASAPMIEVARERLPEADFRVGDMEELPFDDEAFDTVMAASSLQYTEDRVQALRELRRVCAPNGRVVVALWDVPEKVAFRAVFAAVVGVLPAPPPGKGPFELSLPGVLEAMFEQAGMTVVGSGTADCPFVYPDFETLWKANAAAGPFQATMRVVGKEKLYAAVRDAVGVFRVNGHLRLENSFRYVAGTP